MITDEQRKAFEDLAKWMCLNVERDGDYLSAQTRLCYAFWQAAQQVKPLMFVKRQFHVPVGPDAHLVADCIVGKYLIHMVAYPVIAKMKYFFSGPEFGTHTNYYERKKFDTEAEAIKAANDDYRSKVLSCLVHGGV